MSSIWDSSLHEFVERTASRDPVPGGGSVAAVAAAQGLALIVMALEIAARRKDPHPELSQYLKQGKELMGPMKASADEDILAFGKYMDALQLPKGTPQHDAVRQRALAVAASHALEAPLRAAERCLEGLTLAREAIRLVHAGIASDVGAGAALMHGALTAILYNVDINLRGIADPNEHREALASREDLQRRGDELAYIVQRETAAKIAK